MDRGYHQGGRKFNGFSQQASKAEDPEAGKEPLYDEVRENFNAFLADRKHGQPFCYWWGPTNTHRKWVQGSGQKLWGIDPDKLKGIMPDFLPDVPVIREDFADYLGEAQAVDAGLGVLLEELEQRGELENTLVVVSGDHGIPGFPRGKTNLYDFGAHVALAIRWPGAAPGGRVLTDHVNLMDLAPTFLEAGGVPVPKVMTGKSLVPVLKSEKNGQVDAKRDYVIIGRERHVAKARQGGLPYPMRAIRTQHFLYVRNFKPKRWPMGTAPGFGLPAGDMPDYETLRENTFAAFGDFDASPTKAYMLTHRDDPEIAPYIPLGFGRRPGEELYDLRKDPDQIHNLAEDPEYAATREKLSRELMRVLNETQDPRVMGDGSTFDKPPFTD